MIIGAKTVFYSWLGLLGSIFFNLTDHSSPDLNSFTGRFFAVG